SPLRCGGRGGWGPRRGTWWLLQNSWRAGAARVQAKTLRCRCERVAAVGEGGHGGRARRVSGEATARDVAAAPALRRRAAPAAGGGRGDLRVHDVAGGPDDRAGLRRRRDLPQPLGRGGAVGSVPFGGRGARDAARRGGPVRARHEL